MRNRVLEVRIITGPHAGETAFIPRITIAASVSGKSGVRFEVFSVWTQTGVKGHKL